MSLYFQGDIRITSRARTRDQPTEGFRPEGQHLPHRSGPDPVCQGPAGGGLGFKLKVSAGETAKYIHSAGLGNPDDNFDLTEAYLDYVAPLGAGLKLRFGKFATYLGAEVIEARTILNYSRSFLFNYAVPFTHTGFMGGYKFSEAFTANLYLVNGWMLARTITTGRPSEWVWPSRPWTRSS